MGDKGLLLIGLTAVGLAVIGMARATLSPYSEEIVERAGLGRVPPVREKPPKAIQSRNIGTFHLTMETRGDICRIKLIEYLENWKERILGGWSGTNKEECETKFHEVANIIEQVRSEYKEALRKEIGL